MQEVSLSGSLRKGVGKKDAKAIRNRDEVPVVIYGGEKQHHLTLKHMDLYKLLYNHKVHVVKIDAEGTSVKAIVQAVQQHPVTERILHVDFIEVQDNKKVAMEVPLILTGRAPGVMAGGKMNQVFRKLRVSAMLSQLPDSIEVSVKELNIGDSIRISAVSLPGVDILHPTEAVICSVKMARNVIEETTTAEAAPVEGATPTAGAAAAAPADGATAKADGAAKADPKAGEKKPAEKKDKK